MQPQAITFADAFAGIGGFHRALVLAGAVLAWACECNADAAETYRRNFGYDPTGDMATVRAEAVPRHDILCAGFPCQSFSVEGKRLGMNDPRGRLFWHLVRILKAKRPRAFIFENVPHLLRIDGGKTFDMMCGHLTALGYTLRYTLLDARRFGLPQRRERLFIVGTLGPVPFAFPKQGRLATHLPRILQRDVPEKYYYSDEQRSRMAGRRDLARVTRSNRCCNFVKATHANVLMSDPIEIKKNIVVEPGNGRWRRLTPRECARLQGFPATFKLPQTDSKAYRQLGNSVAVPVVQAVARNLVEALRGSRG
ncbi:MAG: DNA cytosine methyltransferase [Phycisphaerae bacterium]